MKIEIEMPDNTVAVIMSYVLPCDTGFSLGMRSIDSENLKDGNKIIICESDDE